MSLDATKLRELAEATRPGHNDDCLFIQDVGPCYCASGEAVLALRTFGFTPTSALAVAEAWEALEWASKALHEIQAGGAEGEACYKDTCTTENCLHLCAEAACTGLAALGETK